MMANEILKNKNSPELPQESIQAEKLERRKAVQEKVELREKEIEQHKEEAKKEALEQAEKSDKERSEEEALINNSQQKKQTYISGKQLRHSFDKQMDDIRAEMSPTSRVFSRFIHLKAIEKTSEVAGATIARQNALFAGSLLAFLSVIFFYFIAKSYGYHLSGFEVIAAFFIGWIGGLLYDLFKAMLTGKSLK